MSKWPWQSRKASNVPPERKEPKKEPKWVCSGCEKYEVDRDNDLCWFCSRGA